MPSVIRQLQPLASLVLVFAPLALLPELHGQTPCPLPGTVSSWTANGNAQDAVGGRHGTPRAGATFGPGVAGQAFRFNGNGAYVDVRDDPAWDFGAGDFSIELWVQFDSATSQAPLVAHDDGGGHVNKWFLYRNYTQPGANTLTFHMNRVGGPIKDITTPWVGAANTWQHMVLTKAGSTWTFFLDGQAIHTEQYSDPVPDSSNTLQFGSMGESGAPFLAGSLDGISIYSRALTPAEALLRFLQRDQCLPFYTTFGSGCAGTRGLPALTVNQLPRIGQPFSLLLTNLPLNQPGLMFLGFSNTYYRGPLQLPIRLDLLGMTGCQLLVSDELVYVIPTTTIFGTVVWSIASGGGTLPNDPTILGLGFYNQGLFLDPGANPAGVIWSNGGHGVVGR